MSNVALDIQIEALLVTPEGKELERLLKQEACDPAGFYWRFGDGMHMHTAYWDTMRLLGYTQKGHASAIRNGLRDGCVPDYLYAVNISKYLRETRGWERNE